MKIKLGINFKIILASLILMIIPSTFIGVYSYKAADKNYFNGVNERLKDQASDWRLLANAYVEEIAAKEASGQLTPEFRLQTIEKIKNLMAKQVIGKTGYIWVVDSAGVY